jgi:hypothetical protein
MCHYIRLGNAESGDRLGVAVLDTPTGAHAAIGPTSNSPLCRALHNPTARFKNPIFGTARLPVRWCCVLPP